jgi:predicted transcriptional regulator
MGLMKDRNRLKIIQDILQAALDEKMSKKTRIMQRAHLDWRSFKRYHGYLMEEGLLAHCNPEIECYLVTDKGKDILYKLKEVDGILKPK